MSFFVRSLFACVLALTTIAGEVKPETVTVEYRSFYPESNSQIVLESAHLEWPTDISVPTCVGFNKVEVSYRDIADFLIPFSQPTPPCLDFRFMTIHRSTVRPAHGGTPGGIESEVSLHFSRSVSVGGDNSASVRVIAWYASLTTEPPVLAELEQLPFFGFERPDPILELAHPDVPSISVFTLDVSDRAVSPLLYASNPMSPLSAIDSVKYEGAEDLLSVDCLWTPCPILLSTSGPLEEIHPLAYLYESGSGTVDPADAVFYKFQRWIAPPEVAFPSPANPTFPAVPLRIREGVSYPTWAVAVYEVVESPDIDPIDCEDDLAMGDECLTCLLCRGTDIFTCMTEGVCSLPTVPVSPCSGGSGLVLPASGARIHLRCGDPECAPCPLRPDSPVSVSLTVEGGDALRVALVSGNRLLDESSGNRHTFEWNPGERRNVEVLAVPATGDDVATMVSFRK